MFSMIKKFILGRKFDACVDAVTGAQMSTQHALGEILKSDDVKKPVIDFLVRNEDRAAFIAQEWQKLEPQVQGLFEAGEKLAAEAQPAIEAIKSTDLTALKGAGEALIAALIPHQMQQQEELAFSFEAILAAEEEGTIPTNKEEEVHA
jgi:hypothetical protein